VKSFIQSIAGANYAQRAVEKYNMAAQIRQRGTPQNAMPPRDIQVQSAAGGVQVSWKLPTSHDNIAGWRIYVNNESNLAAQIRDKGTRQMFIPLGSSSSPSPANIMVSSFTTLGRESSKVVKQGTPNTQSATTTVPTVPPGYDAESAGGVNRGLIRFNGESQYVHS
jgi:hypothetical protein